MLRRFWPAYFALGSVASPLFAQNPSPKPTEKEKPINAVVAGLWFTQMNGLPEALTPAKDRQLKFMLISNFAKEQDLTIENAKEFLDKDHFQKLIGNGCSMSLAGLQRYIHEGTPKSRKDMHEKVRAHADLLTTQFDLIEEQHRKPADELVTWIVKNYKPGKPLNIITVCTKNTRRSVLSSTMGNIAATYYGLTDIHFFSGGTDPDAINPRSVASLKEIGVVIDDTGKEATRGMPKVANPIYRLQWGKGQETTEFSKKYSDAHNPQEGFAAIMVCSEVDTACPKVSGASVRIPLPYLDPKAFDNSPFETAKYAERRDDIGRLMLCVMMQAKRKLELEGKLK